MERVFERMDTVADQDGSGTVTKWTEVKLVAIRKGDRFRIIDGGVVNMDTLSRDGIWTASSYPYKNGDGLWTVECD